MDKEQSVLVVDDAVVWRRLLVTLLTRWGYQVYEAEDGETALDMLASTPVNLILSDWEMPGMDGVSLCKAVRQRFNHRYIYLILLTARESIEDLRIGFDAGADDFLRKPVNQTELQARIRAGERILHLETTLAARNARLSEALQQIEVDLQAAAKLQQSLLPPHALSQQGWYADWLFMPSKWVSGDLFNIFPLSESTLAFYSVDVAGHGVTAAMMSVAVARQFLHGRTVEPFLIEGETITPPHRVVEILNQRFCAESDEVLSYFTLVYGVIDRLSGEGQLCHAGHPTPFIIPAGRAQAVREVGSGGPPVGLFSHFTWEDTAFRLQPGERLCLYSDGITECENERQQMFGVARLHQAALAHPQEQADSLFPALRRQLEAWQGGADQEKTAADDISLLVIQRMALTEDHDEG